MSALAEAIISAFDSNTPLIWFTEGLDKVFARFAVGDSRVEVVFTATEPRAWRVGFDVISNIRLSTAAMPESIRILSGVFQAVHEFLEIRQPERLVFAAKAEAMGEIYQTYLARQHTALSELGYRTAPLTKASPFVEFTIEKTTPSTWRG